MNREFHYRLVFELDKEPWARTSILAAAATRAVKPGLLGADAASTPDHCMAKEIHVVDEDKGWQVTVGYDACSGHTFLTISAPVERLGNPWELVDLADVIIANAKSMYEKMRPGLEAFENEDDEEGEQGLPDVDQILVP